MNRSETTTRPARGANALDLDLGGNRTLSWPGQSHGGKGAVMELLSIGEFAKGARLSPKALRLYDDMGLLVPARVDAASG